MDRKVEVSPAVLIGVGGAFFLTWSALLWLMFRGPRQALNGPPINIYNNLGPGTSTSQLMGHQPIQVVQAPTIETAALAKSSKLKTFTLSTTNVSHVMTAASAKHWRVQLRNIGPPGSFAYVATDSAAVSYPSMSITIPAGPPTEIRVSPNEALYAVGSIAGVQLSMSASEEIG